MEVNEKYLWTSFHSVIIWFHHVLKTYNRFSIPSQITIIIYFDDFYFIMFNKVPFFDGECPLLNDNFWSIGFFGVFKLFGGYTKIEKFRKKQHKTMENTIQKCGANNFIKFKIHLHFIQTKYWVLFSFLF